MSNLIEKLIWDTEFFGIPIGRINVSSLSEPAVSTLLVQARNKGLQCLYFEADPDDFNTVRAVEQHQFQLVDVRVVLEHPFSDRPAPAPRFPVPPELFITPPQNGDLPQLIDLAMELAACCNAAIIS